MVCTSKAKNHMVLGGAAKECEGAVWCWMMLSDVKIDNLMVESIAAGSAIAPFPVSPHASFLDIGEMTIMPRSSIEVKWRWVKGLVHINVFIAGATNIGFEKSQARTMHVRRLSQSPPATCTSHKHFHSSSQLKLQNDKFWKMSYWGFYNSKWQPSSRTYPRKPNNRICTFASVLADRGAMSMASAHFRSSIWRTLSPILLQLDHSSSSVYNFTLAGRPLLSTKCNAGFVATALTSAQSDRLSASIPNFIAATLPLAAKIIRGFRTPRFSHPSVGDLLSHPNDRDLSEEPEAPEAPLSGSFSLLRLFASDVRDAILSVHPSRAASYVDLPACTPFSLTILTVTLITKCMCNVTETTETPLSQHLGPVGTILDKSPMNVVRPAKFWCKSCNTRLLKPMYIPVRWRSCKLCYIIQWEPWQPC